MKRLSGPTNKHRYILAAQSRSLRQSLQTVPGVPIIHFNPRGVLVLSPPSRATLKNKDALEQERRMEGGKVLEVVEEGGNVVSGVASTSAMAKRGRVKAPNPMSVKKKKKKALALEPARDFGREDEEVESVRKRVREVTELDDGVEADGVEAGSGEEGDEVGRRKRKRKRRGKASEAGAVVGL